MGGKQRDARHLALWIGVIVVVAVLIVIWVMVTRNTFNQINQEAGLRAGKTPAQVAQEVEDAFNGVDKILKQNEAARAESPAITGGSSQPAVDLDVNP